MWNFSELETISKLVIVILGGFILYQTVSYLSQGTLPNLSMKGGKKRQSKYQSKKGGAGTSKLYLFYTPWCSHCTTIRCGEGATEDNRPNGRPNPDSAWGKIFYKYRNSKEGVKAIEIDADNDKSKTMLYNVDAYPTIVLVKPDGSHKEFTGENTSESIAKFIKAGNSENQ